ncbi:MAG: tripartite tricarboxylate transporter substrate binding protein [Hypericibacter sp.]
MVPFAPGGGTDILARSVGQQITQAWGQPVVIDNRPGAGGTTGSDLVARGTPDGYTLLMGTIATHAINPTLQQLPYDPIESFRPISRIALVPNILVIHPSVPARSVAEFIELAKSRPGKMNYASAGNGTSGHLTGELFKSMAKVNVVHIPYKGAGPAITDVIAGQVQATFGNILSAVPHVRSGKLRALGVTGQKRAATLPDVPPIADTIKDFEAVGWFALYAPARTPDAIVRKLSAEVRRIIGLPAVSDSFLSQGADPSGNTPEELKAFMIEEMRKWRDVIRAADVKTG